MTDATPSPPPAAPTDPVVVLAQLADAAGHASTLLFDYRRDNPGAPDLAQALNLEMTLDKRAIELRTQAVAMLGDRVAEALAQLQDATRRIDDFLHGVKTTQARFGVASAVIALAGAALVGDAGGILSAVGNVHDALKTLQDAARTA
ncbi:MAG: hypothetical protein ACTHL8_22810 [Burkholderiaceae bacterium]